MNLERKNTSYVEPLTTIDLDQKLGFKKTSGKVRDVFTDGERLILVSTDRLSAFDHNIGFVPDRGRILNQLSQWWFEKTQDIVQNHMVAVPDPNVMVGQRFETVPVEMVVRGYNTGTTDTSIWHRYSSGQRVFGGIVLPDGMSKNDRLPKAVFDPTTKAIEGHDEEITVEKIIEMGLMTEDEYAKLQEISLALFERGQQLALDAGLMLVDTKYEFGRDSNGNFVLIDEIHTPDSSRFWDLETYEDRIKDGLEPDNYDKEFARIYLKGLGYNGDGVPPQIPQEIISEVRRRYIEVYERLTGYKFKPNLEDSNLRITSNIENWILSHPEVEPQRPQKALILMGSESDLEHSKKIAKVFEKYNVDADIRIGSAHKTPEYVLKMVKDYGDRNLELAIIVVAGRSNALGGLVDFQTTAPVISCPPYSDKFGGTDIYSSLRMPSGSSGVTVLDPEAAANHVLRIFALSNSKLERKLKEEAVKTKLKVTNADKNL